MRRRDFILGAAAAAGATAVAAATATESDVQPNPRPASQRSLASDAPIVFIILDDWMNFAAVDRYIPNWPRRSAFDPWTRSYARNNLWFTNAHTASPSCPSSRVAMLWDVPPHESGCYNIEDADVWKTSPAIVGRRSIVGQLKDAGWNTQGFGKIFHSIHEEEHDPDCWTDYTPIVWKAHITEGEFSSVETKAFGRFGSATGVGPERMSDHNTVTQAVRFIRQMGNGDAAFVGIRKPHVPLRVPEEFFDVIDPSEIVLPEWNKVDVTGEAAYFLRNAADQDMIDIRDAGEWRLLIQSYLAAVKYADYEFGRVIRSVPKNARVILTSDHGFALGERGALTKATLWDQSTAVPIILGGVGLTGTVRTAVSLLDVGSTIQDFAGLPIQNESLFSVAQRPTDSQRAVTTSYRTTRWAGSRLASSVRRGDYQLIVYQDGSQEFYNVRNDPLELVDLSQDRSVQGFKRLLMKSIPQHYA